MASLATFGFLSFLLQVLFQLSYGDIYFHAPRGSNNRLKGEKANRQNANRVFDSQNNAKGGYNAGEIGQQKTENSWYNMKYFMSGPKAAKTILSIEWTNQHGCGDADLNCNIVLQSLCQPTNLKDPSRVLRNGNSESTPQFKFRGNRYKKYDYATIQRHRVEDARLDRALNEQWEWYDKCATRRRNSGLFTADQKLKRNHARFTRQNPNGKRYGYECPEERDYYPYFHPTDWTDIAVLANKMKDCSYYKSESFNTKPKGECMELHNHLNRKKTESQQKTWHPTTNPWRHSSIYNNKEECEKSGAKWVAFSNYLETINRTKEECTTGPNGERLIWAIPYRTEDIAKMPGPDPEQWKRCLVALDKPDCRLAPHTRTNHLGNAKGVVPLTYDWVLPHFPSGQEQRCVLRIRYNISTNDYDPSNTFSDKNGADKSPIKNDPKVLLGKKDDNKVPVQLAINTAQFGRTFQDRSHIFRIIPRKEHFKDKTIYNLNVRGKRGNIVQVYPAVEYDFVPKRLKIKSDDLVHIQWTGSNRNPAGNDGEGRKQTDRSNMVGMDSPSKNYPLADSSMFDNARVVQALEDNGDTPSNADVAVAMATAGYFSSVSQVPSPFNVKGCTNTQAAQLDCYSPSFSGFLLQFNKGTYYYMCSRNNNFTNRNQKGSLTVS